MDYCVPGMALIPQKSKMACWYASAQMLVQWHREKFQRTDMDLPDPSEVPGLQALMQKDTGISDTQIVSAAKQLGLQLIPPMSPLPQTLLSWLKRYGPLWINGYRHITVMAGIRDTKTDTELLIYDPAPVGVGKIEWRSLPGWYIGDSWSGRDTTTNSGVFMYNPA